MVQLLAWSLTWLALLAAVGLWWVVPRWYDRARTRAPACRVCGYMLSGLPGAVCPECGESYMSQCYLIVARPPASLRAACWILLCLLLLTGAPALVLHASPMLPVYEAWIWRFEGRPESDAYSTIAITGRVSEWTLGAATAPSRLPQAFTVSLTDHSGKMHDIEVSRSIDEAPRRRRWLLKSVKYETPSDGEREAEVLARLVRARLAADRLPDRFAASLDPADSRPVFRTVSLGVSGQRIWSSVWSSICLTIVFSGVALRCAARCNPARRLLKRVRGAVP